MDLSPLQIIESLVATATGPTGLGLIFVYSVLVAFILPLPGELVLLPAPGIALGLSPTGSIAVVILVSALGKAIGSLAALRIGQEAVNARPARWLVRRAFPRHDPEAPPGRLTRFVERHGYIGMGLLLSVPLMPDTAVVYAFSVVDTDERLFALAAFLGTVARLVVAAAIAAGVFVAL